jgi:hypothetical protein
VDDQTQSDTVRRYANAYCAICGKHDYVTPLHGDAGGPMCCMLCKGQWHAEHGRKRRTGRIAIRAIMAFLDAGGSRNDIEKLTDSAMFGDVGFLEITDRLGYMDGIARMDGADVDLTSELLADILALTHPDHHPPERQQLAHRVTQGLLALKPFVFPAPKPKPSPPTAPSTESKPKGSRESKPSQPQPRYPCVDCADTTPAFYCDPCRTEWQKRQHEEFEQRTTKQRAEYKRRRQEKLARRSSQRCESCGTEFKRTRTDARYCSNACRQRAHRQPVTDKSSAHMRLHLSVTSDAWERGILALLERHPAVFLNDLLPEERTRAQYQALVRAAVKLEDEGKIDSFSYMFKMFKPGHKVLLRRGYQFNREDEQIHRLTAEEQRAFQVLGRQGGVAPVA